MKAALLLLFLAVTLSLAVFRDQSAADRGKQEPTVLFQVIEALFRLRPFRLDAVSRITETTLRQSGSNEYFAMFTSVRGGRAPVREVELRLPKPASSKKDGILILTIDTAARITTDAVEQRFGARPDLSVAPPAAPYEIAYTYPQPWGKVSFQFARGTRCLVAVILDAVEPPPATTAERWLDTFAVYPGARELCSQHVTGNAMHILWHAYATRDLPEKVIAFYVQAEGKEHAEQSENSVTFRHGDKVLSIHRASAKDYPECGKPPRPEEKTVLIVSQAIRSS
ncbi:MAG: hypothetical protein FJW34_08665 [Acidobacteria bacterium]|nr:hypothetical protein [Acidobacteriota bacterium]